MTPTPGERREAAERALVRLLQLACSGELAAGLAYRGHSASVADPDERADIQRIEDEEWLHRRHNAALLARLGAAPSAPRERIMALVGGVLGRLCHLTGWLLPMYGAALLETKNVKEYDDAARYAEIAGHADFVPCLREMADVELEHERYFKAKVRAHPIGRRLPLPRSTRGAASEIPLASPAASSSNDLNPDAPRTSPPDGAGNG